MSYIENRTINGRRYKYLRKTVRDGEKTLHVTLKYLGPMDPIYKIGGSRHKSNASIYVRPLDKEEKDTLEKNVRSSNSFIRDRAKIILLSSKRLFAQQIAEKIECEARKVRYAIKQFNAKGCKALQRGKSKGAKPRFTEDIKRNILRDFSKKPVDFGYSFTTWTLPRFTKYLIDHKVVDSISIETVRQIIIASGARLKRSKRWQYSPDKEFLKKR